MNGAADLVLSAVEQAGVLLIHDRILPSVTALIAGEPIEGSWWAHHCANEIYNAVEAIDDKVATAKLIKGKDTLIASG